MIAFTTPWVLAGLVLAAVPILLHLVARREPPAVDFPAVRYLEETSRRHQRRVHLQHWVLLLARTLLILLLVLAAAGPTRSGGTGLGGHAPTALVLILDNSLSSGAVRADEPTLSTLKVAARTLLDRATAGDRLWVLTADGIPRSGSMEELRRVVDSLEVSTWRLDLGTALTSARALLASSPLPGEVVMLTDLQASAISAAEGEGEGESGVVIGVPSGAPPSNLGITSVETGAQPWLGAGRLTVSVHGDSGGDPRPLRVVVAGRESRQILVEAGESAAIPLPAPAPGWLAIEVRLDPDELRGDDLAVAALRQAVPTRVRWDTADQYISAAMDVLLANGRISRGVELTVGSLGPGPSIVLPPADPAGLGAVNRALMARGVGWTFGDPISGPGRTDSSAVLPAIPVARRHRLVAEGSGGSGVVIAVDGEPWLVRSNNVILIASRLEPGWTDLPLTASYMPFMDALVNRHAHGELSALRAAPGQVVHLPGGVTGVTGPGGDQVVESGGTLLAAERGLYWLLSRGDTVGVLTVNPDSREGQLAPASEAAVRALWPGARVVSPDRAAALAFSQAARADLRGPLLWLVLVLLFAELLLGGSLRRRAP